MELKIVDKKKNELLKRTELVVDMHEKTIPSKKLIAEKLSAMVNTPIDRMVITKIVSKFGSSKAKIYVRTYETVEALKKSEPKYIVVRNFGKEKKEGEATADANAPASFKK